jgi:hypothetical protein
VLIVALLYRRLLNALISGGVTRLRAGPFELAWNQAKSGLERPSRSAKVRSVAAPADTAGPRTSLLGADLVNLAETDAREAILRAYEAVREALGRALQDAGIEVESESLDALSLVREAESHGVTPPETTDAVLGLKVLGNLARHAPSRELSPARAYEYLAMTDGALYSLATALKKHLVGASTTAAA